MTRRGFSVLELLLAITIAGILVNIAIPFSREARRRAEGAAVVGDLHTIQTALMDFYADNGAFPRSAGFGSVPRGLDASLPAGFDFRYEDTNYAWFNITFGGRRRVTYQFLYVQGTDPKLIRYVASAWGERVVLAGNIALLFIE